LSHF
jgi:RNA polymerase-associated protein CTR9